MVGKMETRCALKKSIGPNQPGYFSSENPALENSDGRILDDLLWGRRISAQSASAGLCDSIAASLTLPLLSQTINVIAAIFLAEGQRAIVWCPPLSQAKLLIESGTPPLLLLSPWWLHP